MGAVEDVLARWRADGDPLLALQVASRFPAPGDRARDELRAAARAVPQLVAAFAAQRADGSWGPDGDPSRRVLSTLWMAKVLAELDLAADDDRWSAAAEFLAAAATPGDGVFSRTGTPDGVLACYVGIAAATWLLGGREDLAEPCIAWLARHQEVRRDGASLRGVPVTLYRSHLRVRYGGCMAESATCLIGLVKNGQALRLWTARRDDPAAADLLGSIREAFLQRGLYRRADGAVLPLGTPPADPARWLQPSFPLDWRTDLIEVLDLVAGSGPPDERAAPAVEELRRGQLADGTWPLRRTFWPADLPPLERRSRTRGSPLVTLRALAALGSAMPPAAPGRRG